MGSNPTPSSMADYILKLYGVDIHVTDQFLHEHYPLFTEEELALPAREYPPRATDMDSWQLVLRESERALVHLAIYEKGWQPTFIVDEIDT